MCRCNHCRKKAIRAKRIKLMMNTFDEMLRLDANNTGIAHVLILMGSRKKYAEHFAKACETVLDKNPDF